MQQVFLDNNPIDNCFTIDGLDAHHLIKVVRIRIGEKLRISSSTAGSFLCEVSEIASSSLTASIIQQMEDTELSNKIYLFQALPKGDRIETVIEKCVELGVYEIIPVQMKNCIVKLDDKKKKSKVERYNAIAKSAAEQSKRSIIPKVREVMSFNEAVAYAKGLDIRLFPYESKHGMSDTYASINKIEKGMSIGVFVGPEGGFSPEEVDIATESMEVISLGKRILRTDTAAICSLSMLMLKCEEF